MCKNILKAMPFDTFRRYAVVAPLGCLMAAFVSFDVSGGQIAGGETARDGQFPWMAAIVRADTVSAREGHLCGGTLVAQRWILTAAHCVTRTRDRLPFDAATLDVVLGRVDLSNEYGERIRARRIVVHPAYAGGNQPDLALVELSRASEYPAVELVASANTLERVNTRATIAGWGHSDEHGDVPAELQYTEVPVIELKSCETRYGTAFVSENMLCAGVVSGGRGACLRDSGGPLFVEAREGARVQQIGVISFGVGCGRINWPGLYARISQHRPWIDQTIDAPGVRPGGGATGERLTARFSIRCMDLTCQLDARHSQSGQTPIREYRWRMSDGTRLRGHRRDHHFIEPGIYKVILTIVDKGDRRASSMRRIAVSAPRVGSRAETAVRGNTNAGRLPHYVQNRRGFWSNRGQLRGQLRSFGQADHVLTLQKRRLHNRRWFEVARSDRIGRTEIVRYRAEAGYYRWVVLSAPAAGRYRLQYLTP